MRTKKTAPDPEAKRQAFAEYNWQTVAEVAAALSAGDDFVRDRIHAPCTCASCRALPEAERFRFKDVARKGSHYLINPAEVERYYRMHKIDAAA